MAKILIVDDSIAMRKNLKIILKDLGHEVIAEAANGKEAFREYKVHQPDLVTMDISMPTLDGIGSVRMILEEFPDANIIMITALGQRNSVYEAVKNGAKGYLVKPIEAEKLKEIISNVLSSPKKPGVSAKKPNAEKIEEKPFTIENVSGKFIVKINDNMNSANFKSLHDTLQGMKYIKPLDITFDFSGSKNVASDMLDRINHIVKEINDSGEKAILLYDQGIGFI